MQTLLFLSVIGASTLVAIVSYNTIWTKITNESIADDGLWERQIIHLLELVMKYNRSCHELYLGITNDMAPSWMLHCDEF